MTSFIRVIEIWVPDAEHTLLEFGGGYYGGAPRFRASSRDLCFGRGEGLPGQAWEQRRPIVLTQFDGSVFRRTSQATAEGLTCGIALPVFADNSEAARLKAVLLIFCGDDEGHAGAIELWHNDPAASKDLVLDDGYYGHTADAFEFMSRRTSFRKGTGLPGMAWEAGSPVFLPDLGKGGRFLRADSAVKVGINRGFAFPCASADSQHWVLAFLSALATPIVRRFETWLPAADGGSLTRSEGFCESSGPLPTGLAAQALVAGPEGGALGQALARATPVASEQLAAEPGLPGQGASAGLSALVALPVLQHGRVVAVMGWYF